MENVDLDQRAKKKEKKKSQVQREDIADRELKRSKLDTETS